MVYKLVIHDVVREAYYQIVDYLLLISNGPNAAKSFMDCFDKLLEAIQDNPDLHGLSRVDALANAGYHAVLVNGYIVLYYVVENVVHVAYLFHQSQDYARYVIG